MSNSKHTKGPWELTTIQGEPHSQMIHNADNEFICDFNTSDQSPMTAEDRANAALIASAPDLLSALELLVARFPEMTTDEPISGADVIQTLCDDWSIFTDVIKQAKGES